MWWLPVQWPLVLAMKIPDLGDISCFDRYQLLPLAGLGTEDFPPQRQHKYRLALFDQTKAPIAWPSKRLKGTHQDMWVSHAPILRHGCHGNSPSLQYSISTLVVFTLRLAKGRMQVALIPPWGV